MLLICPYTNLRLGSSAPSGLNCENQVRSLSVICQICQSVGSLRIQTSFSLSMRFPLYNWRVICSQGSVQAKRTSCGTLCVIPWTGTKLIQKCATASSFDVLTWNLQLLSLHQPKQSSQQSPNVVVTMNPSNRNRTRGANMHKYRIKPEAWSAERLQLGLTVRSVRSLGTRTFGSRASSHRTGSAWLSLAERLAALLA